jgi:hypothetical protein
LIAADVAVAAGTEGDVTRAFGEISSRNSIGAVRELGIQFPDSRGKVYWGLCYGARHWYQRLCSDLQCPEAQEEEREICRGSLSMSRFLHLQFLKFLFCFSPPIVCSDFYFSKDCLDKSGMSGFSFPSSIFFTSRGCILVGRVHYIFFFFFLTTYGDIFKCHYRFFFKKLK